MVFTKSKASVKVAWSILVAACVCLAPVLRAEQNSLQQVIDSEHRSEANRARDKYRHPLKTIEFFGVNPQMDVLEIWPGGGWYSEILAPYIKGDFYAAHFNPQAEVAYFRRSRDSYSALLAASPQQYSRVKMTYFDPGANALAVPDASVDAVLTFRNVHNWLKGKSEHTAFELFYRALRPGGVLGVVEHRAPAGRDWQSMRSSGYMTEAYVINLAQRAGFVLEASAEINANPADSTDHPRGVWTLPPSLSLKDLDREHYLAVGESDRMTLRFRKPAHTSGNSK